MIQIKSGVYGGKKGLKRASDGPFSLSAAEEARLVERGVAKYVGDPVEEADIIEGKSIDAMTVAELRQLGKEYGLTFKVGITKATMIEAIVAEMEKVEPVDEDAPVDEEPVEEEPVEEEEPEEDAPTFDPAEAVQ